MAGRKLSTLVTVLGGLAVTLLVGLSVACWVAMFFPVKSAWVAGALAAFLPGFLLNRLLTSSYRKLENDASEAGSLFGALGVVNGAVLAVLWFGLLGQAAHFAMGDALTTSWVTLGFLDTPLDATLPTFPGSTQGTGVIWAPNLGTTEQPRVVARMADGWLRAAFVPPRGSTFECRTPCLAGPVDAAAGRVMLCPVPESADLEREVSVTWEGGVARFIFRSHEQKALFIDKR